MRIHPLVYLWRRISWPKTVRNHGVLVETDPARIGPRVAKWLYKGAYERPEVDLVRRALRPGDRVLELGGGLGYVALHVAKVVGADRLRIYEANPRAAEQIRRNFALNGWTPDLCEAAIHDHDGEVEFFVDGQILSSSVFDRALEQRLRVPCRALQAVLDEYHPTALVVDIEGLEAELLPAVDLDGVDDIVLELHPHIVGEDATRHLLDALAGQGFTIRERRDQRVVWLVRSIDPTPGASP